MNTSTAACPKCGGTSGHEHVMTESHVIAGSWGDAGNAGESGLNVRHGRVKCLDCGEHFSYKSMKAKGLLGPSEY